MKLQDLKYPVLAAAAGILIGRFAMQPPSKVETKEVVKYVEKQQEKKQENKHKNVVIIEKKNKDGSVEKRTEIKEDTASVSKKDSSSQMDSSKSNKITKGSGFTLGVLAISDLNFSGKLEYGATATIPLAGAIKVQALGTTDKKIGVGLAIDF